MKVWMPGFAACSTAFNARSISALLGAREAHDARTSNFLTNPAHRIEIAVRRCGKAGFDHVDAELLQLTRDDDFLFGGHARARRLLAVAQSGVENLYYVFRLSPFYYLLAGLIRWPAQKQKLPRQGQREYQFTFD